MGESLPSHPHHQLGLSSAAMKTTRPEDPVRGDRMRIVAWNCLQGLNRKAEQLLTLQPDVAVVAECTDEPQLGAGPLRSVGWTGRNPHKGLAIFAKPDLGGHVAGEWDPAREWFLPIRLDFGRQIDIIGVWAMNHRGSESGPKRERTQRALEYYEPLLAEGRTIIVGDFNANARWDTPGHPEFRALVAWLAQLGYSSVYHSLTREEHGKETGASLYWQHHRDQPYLVDHAFVPTAWLPSVTAFELGNPDDWLLWSDHVPVVFELRLPPDQLPRANEES